MSRSLDKLKDKLNEIFQLDQADLDFGIYRIMNQKRDEITRFLEHDLLPQVKAGFEKYRPADKAEIQKELDDKIRQYEADGVDPDTVPRVKELREKLKDSVDISALEDEVYTHLYNFFRRYYQEGDFISLRRYKEGVYAIPYEGEEVKLHWANSDQYYIKTTEYFRDYAFTLSSGKKVHFKLIEADTEKDNIKASNGNDRRFILCDEAPIVEQDGELLIRFEYRPDDEKRKQKALNDKAIETIFAASGITDWLAELSQKNPTPSNPDRTLLEKRLTDYTARNTFDYFIHKDLGKFLRRELDFYIKNEIMHLDDIEEESAPRADQYLSKIKVIRSIAHKIIAFLAQIEDFQKKLWLKKKFVIETNYCITLDRVPEQLYPEIIVNDAQRNEWIKLFAIDEIEGDTITPAYSNPLTIGFLKANLFLVLDTKYFSDDFKDKLLASLENIDYICDGFLISSENFQALNLLNYKYSNKCKCIYIDPPYNSDASAILYKNDYKDSSWLSLIENRIVISKCFLLNDGIICVAIDDEEIFGLRSILDQYFIKNVGIVAVRSNPAGRKTKGRLAPAHEYALFYGNSEKAIPGSLSKTEKSLARYPKEDSKGRFAWANFIRSGSNDKREDRPKLYYPILVNNDDSIRIPTMKWSGIRQEYELLEQPRETEVIVFPIVEKQGHTIEKNWQRGHERVKTELEEFRIRRTPEGHISIDFKTRMDEASLPITWWDDKKYASANYGAAELKDLFGEKLFDFAKSTGLIEDCLKTAGLNGNHSHVLDYFSGSGTTGHAVINLNRGDKGQRKYILVEMGEYFDTVLKPRISKAVYSDNWKEGKPVNRQNGVSHLVKYIRLESYEDTLNNLEFKKSKEQQELLETQKEFGETYKLSYMLDVETEGSNSLLNLNGFSDPFNYTMNISTGSAGETKTTKIDLVETFNYLIGLTVQYIDHIQGFKVIQGTNPKGDKVLIIWRNLKDKSNADLDEFFRRQEYNPRDMEFDLIYVNGDNNLENLRREDETWKVRLIEEDFKRLMFEAVEI